MVGLSANVLSIRAVQILATMIKYPIPPVPIINGKYNVPRPYTSPNLFFDWGPKQPMMNVNVGFGGEVLFSVASAQIGFYGYLHAGVEVGAGEFDLSNFGGKSDFLDQSVTLYHGWIWNLWNAKDYEGPFLTVNVGAGKNGVSLFKDFFRPFAKGPYGIAFTFGHKSRSKAATFTIGGSGAFYFRVPVLPAINCSAPWKVAFWWTLAEAGVWKVSAMTRVRPDFLVQQSVCRGRSR
jgi:hypothetical protein